MKENQMRINFSTRAWKLLISIKFTVSILFSLALTSIIGTLIPQNADKSAYLHKYGEKVYSVFRFFDLFDMYHSWWFQFLLLMLTLSILLCSIDRLNATWKIIFPKNPKFNVSSLVRSPIKEEFSTILSLDTIKVHYGSIISGYFKNNQIQDTHNDLKIYAEKGRWTRLGVYVVHFSIILLLLGGLLGSFMGFEGYVNITEGNATNRIVLKKTGRIHNLDFDIRCDDFDVTFYDTGMAKEYRSKLSIIKDSKVVLKKDIIVNDPLRYEGINIFQSSYGMAAPNEITLNFEVKKSGKVYTKKVSMGEQINIPESNDKFLFKDFTKSYHFRGNHLGESVIGAIVSDAGRQKDIALPLNFERFDAMRRGKVIISVKELDQSYYTGLQVTHDPGVPLVYLSFFAMLIGFYITFFMSHQKLFIQVSKKGDQSKVFLHATSNKNHLDMKNKANKISKKLTALENN